jgi:hypothetical protein
MRISLPMRNAQRRGAAVVAMVVAMLVTTLIILGLVLGGARDQDLSLRRLETIRAFYAAEAGANMSIREILLNVDCDGDGGVGTISDDGNAANDPTIGAAQVFVTRTISGSQTTLESQGRCGSARRKIEAVMQ